MYVTKTTLSMEFYTQQDSINATITKQKKVLHLKVKNVEANVPRESEESDSVSEEE